MTADPTPVPQAPTPRTPAQVAAIHGANAVQSYDDEAATPAFPCPYWHWVDNRPVGCVKPAGHQLLETWALMAHADASDDSSGVWFGIPAPVLARVAEAALAETSGGAA